MKFKEIVARLTGFSVPIFGVSWNPPEAEVAKARRIITFMEDHRVLFNPYELELPEHCVHSIIEIRKFLTSELSNIDTKSPLGASVRAMRASCRKFLDKVDARGDALVQHAWERGHWASWEFNSALGELRGVFGIHLAQIAAEHGLDIEKPLADILPERDK